MLVLISQPAVVHVLPSVSPHGVLTCGALAVRSLLLPAERVVRLVLWSWSHPPWPLHPAVVHALSSLSAHGVLFSANRCLCTHTPRSALSSHPAVVHVLPSMSVHGVLTSAGLHVPVVVSHPRLH